MASIISLGFRKKKTSLGWQIFHQVVPFCQVAVFSFKHTQMLYVKVAPGEATNWPSKNKNYTRYWGGKNPLGRGFTGSVTEGVYINRSFCIARFFFLTGYRKTIQFLYYECSYRYIVALGSLRCDGGDSNEDIRNFHV